MKQHLQELLDELHAELGDGTQLDDESRLELKTLAQDIETAVGSDDDGGMAGDAVERLEAAAVGFETQYPRISALLGSMADTLARLGI